MDKLIVIDGNSIANRAFYALPLLSNSSGLHTNAVYGFTTMLLKLLEEEKPTHFLVAFDAGKVTFRHKDYEDYKGGRAKTPPELSEQFPLLRELIRAFSIAQFELEGYEADDIIGTLTRLADARGMSVTVVTGDKDMLQLASEHVTVALTRKGISEVEKYDPAAIKEKYGLEPKQIIDLKGLMGDASDNIPGVPGIGEKTGLKLLHEYGSVENVLANVEQLKGKMKENISAHAEDARMSKELATIYREVPMDLDLDAMKLEAYDPSKLAELFRKLEFKSLLERMDVAETVTAEEQPELVWKLVDADHADEWLGRLDACHTIYAEVIGENPHQADIAGLAFLSDGEAWFVGLDELTREDMKPARDWLSDASKRKTTFDAHKAMVALQWAGIELRGVDFDVLLAAYLLDPTDADLSLSSILGKYAGAGLANDEQVYGKGAKFKLPERDQLGEHVCRKAQATAALKPLLASRIDELGMRELYYDLEHPLSGVLSGMELQGIRVDADGLRSYGEELKDAIAKLEQSIYECAGSEFNINSTKQLGEILFDRLQLPVVKKTKTGYSTDAEVLEKLQHRHEIVPLILHYRTLAKLQSTYIEGLLKEIRESTGKIHTYYRQTIAATGRLSSQFPNLQNIPVRLEEGRKIRKVFIPSEPGWSIVAADYSQIELRVLAHISGDPKLIEAFLEDRDIHTKTAMDVFGVSESQVDANMRRQAKAVNFGIVYGISDYGLSQNLDITRKEAAQFIEQYFSVFQGVRKFMDDVVEQARRDGYVSTLLNRRRYLPEIKSSNFNLRSFAERTAMNTPIQGTAADIIKLAMVKMDEELRRRGLASRMLLQVHDELVFEVPADELALMTSLVPEVMERAMKLAVPLKTEVSVGDNWYEAK